MTPPRTRAQRVRRTVRRILLGALLLFVGLGTLGAIIGPKEPASAAAVPAAATPATTAPAPRPLAAVPPTTVAPVPTTVAPAPTTVAPARVAPSRVAPTTAPTTRAAAPPTTAVRAPQPQRAAAPPVAPEPTRESEPEVYYANCDAVRAAGAAPIRRGDPGYRSGLDRDGDGQGCGQD